MTHRLYYADSYLQEFEAEVIDVRPRGDRVAVVLDRTAFYPTSGGQPHDLGTLDHVAVVDVVEEGGSLLHIVTERLSGRVLGRIDWPRRFDHMQQHTGQHILSAAFLQTLHAQTRSVHFGVETSTVTLELADLSAEAATQVEDLANAIVFEDRPILVTEVDEAGLPGLGLRRPPKRGGRIRVVEVQGFDRSACGGTHVRRTGEVGPIKLRRWERAKGGIRTEFLCGWRSLQDYRWKNAMVVDLAARFTVKDRELGESIARLTDQVKERERALAEVSDRLVTSEARDRLAAAQGSPKVIAEVLVGRSVEDVADLAGRIVAVGSAIVLFGTGEGKLVFARSPGIAVNLSELLHRVTTSLGGRGGGRAEFAQGAVPAAQVAQAVATARAEAMKLLKTASG